MFGVDGESADARPEPATLTRLLNLMWQGDRGAADQAALLVFAELRRLASARLRAEHPGHTMQTTDLVNEAFVRLLGSAGRLQSESRKHFYVVASRAMRRILLDHARARARRVGRNRIPLDDAAGETAPNGLSALDEALTKLEAVEPEAAEVFELKYYGGRSHQQVAELLDLSEATARRRWGVACAVLRVQLGRTGANLSAV